MSSFLKILLVLIVVAAIVFAITSSKKKEEAVQPAPEPTLTQGTEDTDLNNDLTTIDADLKAVDESSADIDAGLNDKPIQQ